MGYFTGLHFHINKGISLNVAEACKSNAVSNIRTRPFDTAVQYQQLPVVIIYLTQIRNIQSASANLRAQNCIESMTIAVK